MTKAIRIKKLIDMSKYIQKKSIMTQIEHDKHVDEYKNE